MTKGLWFDIGNRNILIDGLTAVKNGSFGLYLEISPGPMVVRNSLLADNQMANLLIAETKNTTIENSIIYGVNVNNPIYFRAGDRTYSDRLGQILGENNGEEFPINLGKTQFRNNVIIDESDQALIVQNVGSLEQYRDDFLKQDYAGSNNVYWAAQEKAFGTGWKDPNDPNNKGSVTDMKGWSDFTGEANYRWIDPQFVNPDNYDFRFKKASPLTNRGYSLPTRKLDSFKVQELKDYQAWIDTLVDKQSHPD
jgi:hypothetical protein